MKKVVSLVLAAVMAFSLTACGSSNSISRHDSKITQEIIDVADEYLTFQLTAREAYDEIKALDDKLNDDSSSVKLGVCNLQVQLLMDADWSEVKSTRDNLASTLKRYGK